MASSDSCGQHHIIEKKFVIVVVSNI